MHHKPEIVLYFARKPVIRREITSFTKAGRRRIQTGKQEKKDRNPVSWYKSGKEGQISVIAEVRNRTSGWRDEQQNQGGGEMAESKMVVKR